MINSFITTAVIATLLFISTGTCRDDKVEDGSLSSNERDSNNSQCVFNGQIGECTPYYLCLDPIFPECHILSPCCLNKTTNVREQSAGDSLDSSSSIAESNSSNPQCILNGKIGECTPYQLCSDSYDALVVVEPECPLFEPCCLNKTTLKQKQSAEQSVNSPLSTAESEISNPQCVVNGKVGECTPYYLCLDPLFPNDGDEREPECPILSPCCANRTTHPREQSSGHPLDLPLSVTESESFVNRAHRRKRAVKIAAGCGFSQSADGPEIADHAKEAEFPWIVGIFVDTETATSKNISAFQCGGSLIHPQVVLTAAHCVEQLDRNKMYVRAGMYDLWRSTVYPSQDRVPKEILIHEEYNSDFLHYDIALIILQTPLIYAENVNTICLPPLDFIFNRTRCFAAGWGQKTYYKVVLESTVKKIDLSIVPSSECELILRGSRLGRHFKLHDSFMCAGDEPKNKDTCIGDGGSPLMCPISNKKNRFYQAGIVSWGIGCNEFPGVYVDVAHFRTWIDKKLGEKNLELSSYSYATKPTQPALIRLSSDV